MALTQGSPLPDVSTTTAQTTTAPDYYTNYLSNLATSGTAATQIDPTKMVAGFSDLQTKGFGQVEDAASSYQQNLTSALGTAANAAKGITTANIESFMNPYTQKVVDEMARLSEQNVQRSILPGLKGAFGGTGGFGSRRMYDASGQTLADIQANLTGRQQEALQSGYTQALNAALQQAQLQNLVAQTQGALASKEQELGLAGAKGLLDAGAIQQAREQSVIDAPLKTASNAAALLRGYTIPTSTTQKYTGPMPGAYASSPLQTIVGLASLFGSNTGGTSPATGTINFLKEIYGDVSDWWDDIFGDYPYNASSTSGGTVNNDSSSYYGG